MYLKKIKYFPSGQLLSKGGKTSLLNKQKMMFYRHSQDDLKMFSRCSNMSIDVLVGLVYPVGLMFFIRDPPVKSYQTKFHVCPIFTLQLQWGRTGRGVALVQREGDIYVENVFSSPRTKNRLCAS